MSYMPPIVSVIIPCFNHSPYLPDALNSVIGQTFRDWECVIVDDGSIDETGKIAKHFSRLSPRIRYIYQEHAGTSAARNRGLQEATGRYIQFLDADDLISPTKLAKQMALLSEHSEPAVCLCDYSYMDPDGRVYLWHDCYKPPSLDARNPLEDLIARWETEISVPVHCLLFDARLFTESGLQFDPDLVSNEDWDCWMILFGLRPTVLHVDEKLAQYRLHNGSKTQNRAEMRRSFLQAINKHRRLLKDDARLQALLAAKDRQIRHLYRDCVLPWNVLHAATCAAKSVIKAPIRAVHTVRRQET